MLQPAARGSHPLVHPLVGDVLRFVASLVAPRGPEGAFGRGMGS